MKLSPTIEKCLVILYVPLFGIIVFALILWRPLELFQTIEIMVIRLNHSVKRIVVAQLRASINQENHNLSNDEIERHIQLLFKKVSWLDFIWFLVKHFADSLQKRITKKYRIQS